MRDDNLLAALWEKQYLALNKYTYDNDLFDFVEYSYSVEDGAVWSERLGCPVGKIKEYGGEPVFTPFGSYKPNKKERKAIERRINWLMYMKEALTD